MLLRFSRMGNSHSYGEVVRDAFGHAGRLLLQICILVNNVGTLIVYMIIIGNILFLILSDHKRNLFCFYSFLTLDV